MLQLYPQIKLIHILAVIASGTLFALRGFALQTGAQWPLLKPIKHLSRTIDTILLATAIVLVTMLHQYPLVHDWLTVKVVLLVVYIALGTVALHQRRPPRMRLALWLAALAVYGFIISVAIAHDPLGVLSHFRHG